jgi:predicted Zn-dependent protease with MMP-like domain
MVRPRAAARSAAVGRLTEAGAVTTVSVRPQQLRHTGPSKATLLPDNGRVITVDPAAFEQMVAMALDSLPEQFAALIENVAVLVESGPGPRGLLGLYEGIPLTSRTTNYAGVLPDRITIYQQAICAICDTEEDVIEEVRRTVIHEVGHYFGIDDDRLRELGW